MSFRKVVVYDKRLTYKFILGDIYTPEVSSVKKKKSKSKQVSV